MRKEQGLTQGELAKNVGISRPYLSDIENSKRQVSGEVMIKIARFLKVKVEENKQERVYDIKLQYKDFRAICVNGMIRFVKEYFAGLNREPSK